MKEFKPPFYLKHPFVQTYLASRKRKVFRASAFLKFANWKLVETKKNVKLLASISFHPQEIGKILFIHGWEGGIDSAYIIRTANYFWKKNFSIIRLNLRDHGETHHLNEGLFNGSLLEETFESVQILSKENANQNPLFIIGFSLGGNFSLRIAVKHSIQKQKIYNLKEVFAICPALDPHLATCLMDENRILRKYFLEAWSKSLRIKEKLFPYLYNFSELWGSKTVMELTEKMIPRYSPFTNVFDYFQTYTLKKEFFQKLNIKSTIFASLDDPVIPYSHFLELENSPYLEIKIQKYGGHCGFIHSLEEETWYSEEILNRIYKQTI